MDIQQLAGEISVMHVDVQKYSRLVIEDAQLREQVVGLILTHPHIMVYYNCFYILDVASAKHPELFMAHWDDFTALLDHKNSYHRDIGLTLIANLTRVDEQNRFDVLFDRYFSHLRDQKFMTSVHCIKNSQKIMRHKPQLIPRIVPLLISTDLNVNYPVKQKELMKGFVLEVLEDNFAAFEHEKGVTDFIGQCAKSLSPKTRTLARNMTRKYALVSNT